MSMSVLLIFILGLAVGASVTFSGSIVYDSATRGVYEGKYGGASASAGIALFGSTRYVSVGGALTLAPADYLETDWSAAGPCTSAPLSAPFNAAVCGTAANVCTVNFPPYGTGRATQNCVAGTIYSGNPGDVFTVAIAGTGTSQPYDLAVYCIDWDSNLRSQTMDLIDAGSVLVPGSLATLSAASYTAGMWVVWKGVSGPVTLRVTRTAGVNAVVSAIAINPAVLPTE